MTEDLCEIDIAVSEGYWDGYVGFFNANWYGEDEETDLWKAYEQGYAKGVAEYESSSSLR